MSESTENKKDTNVKSGDLIKPVAIPESFRRNTVQRCLYLLLGTGALSLVIIIVLWNVNANTKSLFRTVMEAVPVGGNIEIPTDEKKYALLAVAAAFLTAILYSSGLVFFRLVPFGFRLRQDLWRLQHRIQEQAPGELVSLVTLGSDGIRLSGRLMVRLQMLERAYQLFGTRDAVKEANNQLSALEETTSAYALQPLVWFEWLLPILGFIGTVYGITQAVDGLRQGIVIYFNDHQMSETVMTHFADGFRGLAVAFQTTLIALWGLLFVGFVNFLLRMNASQTLVGVDKWCHEAIGLLQERPIPDPLERLIRVGLFETNDKEELVTGEDKRPVQRDKVWREAIQKLLQTALLHKQEGSDEPQSLVAAVQEALTRGLLHGTPDQKQAQPILAMLQDTITRGLLYAPRGAKEDQTQSLLAAVQETLQRGLLNPNEDQPYLPDVRQAIVEEIRRSAIVLAGLQRAMLYEGIKQTFIQYKLIVPPLHSLHQRFGTESAIQDNYLVKPSISTVAELDKDYQIQALAVANSAGRACVGGWKRDINEYFVHETAIEWAQDKYNLFDGIRFEGHAIDNLRGPNVQAAIQAITYNPETQKLFVMCRNGEMRTWLNGQMRPSHPRAIIILIQQPFGWLSGAMHDPFVGRWELDDSEDVYRFKVSPITADRTVTVDAGLKDIFDSMSSGDEPEPDAVKLVTDENILCLGVGRELLVSELKNGENLGFIARFSIDEELAALDVTVKGGFVVFALSTGALFTWQYERKEPPIALTNSQPGRRVNGLYLNEAGDALAALYDGTIVLYDLTKPNEAKIFDTQGDEVTHVARSSDRRSLLVATKHNVIKLFSFGLRL